MSNIKISEMTEATTLGDSDLLTIVQSGINKKITKSNAIGEIITALNNPTYLADTGTSMTLNNTRNGRLKSAIKGNVSQFTTEGKQLFNKGGSHTSTNCTTSINGSAISQTNTGAYARSEWQISNLIVGNTYTISAYFNNSSGSSINIRVYDVNNSTSIAFTPATTETSGRQAVSFVADTTSHYLRFYSNTTNTSNTYEVTFYDAMLNEGTTADYEPYTRENAFS